MRISVTILVTISLLLLTCVTTAQFGTRPNDMHIDQSGYPSPGSTLPVTFRVTNNPGPGLGYQAAVSQGWSGITVPGGILPLAPDSFFYVSATNSLPTVFKDFGGTLDNQGIGQGSINIPFIPALNGTILYAAFVVYDNTGIQGISRAHKIQIQDGPQTAAVGNTPSNNIEVVDVVAKSIIKAVPAGNFAQSPFYDLSTKNIIVSTWAGQVNVIDTSTNTIVNSMQISGNNIVGGTAVMTTNGERYFFCNASTVTPSIVEVDAATLTEVKSHTFRCTFGCGAHAIRRNHAHRNTGPIQRNA